MLVGQNPGAQEDLEGVAFLGKSGKLLDSMLADAGYDPAEVRVTNAVRCKTPDNRPPTPAEIEACRVHLQAEIEQREPRTIIALGDTALRSLSKKSGVSSKRGTSVQLHGLYGRGTPVWVTYHPAYVLRNPPSRDTVVADLRKAREGERDVSVPYRMWDGASDPDIEGQYVAIDIETDWVKGVASSGTNIIQMAAATGDETVVTYDCGELAGSIQGTLVGHNSWQFDIPRLNAAYGLDLPLGDDTMVLAYLDNETQPLALESLCVKYLGVPGWKEGINAQWGSPEFALYNARDARYTLDLHGVLLARLGPRALVAEQIIKPAFVALRSCSERGIYLDRDAIDYAYKHFSERVAYGSRGLRALGNITSPGSGRQIGRALAREGHVLPGLPSGDFATDSGTLSNLEQTQLVRAVKYYRKATKALQAVEAYYKLSETGDGRAHTDYTLWRTVTGRSSARRPNVQNLARDPLLRNFFSAPPGSEYWTVDYAAIEFRVAAFIAGASSIIDRYAANPEWDPHRFVASILYSKPESEVTPNERRIAKSANFGLLYMAQWFTLQGYALKTADLRLSETECKRIRATWHTIFPEFKAWYADTRTKLRAQGYIQSLTGRRRNFGDTSLLSWAQFDEALREAVNFQVQSLAADIALLGLAACQERGLPINGFFHDAISFEFPVVLEQHANDELHDRERNGRTTQIHGDRIRQCLTECPVDWLKEHWGIDFNIPLVVEAKVKAHGRDTRTFFLRSQAL